MKLTTKGQKVFVRDKQGFSGSRQESTGGVASVVKDNSINTQRDDNTHPHPP